MFFESLLNSRGGDLERTLVSLGTLVILFNVPSMSEALNVSNADICSSHHFGSSIVHDQGEALNKGRPVSREEATVE